MKMPSFLIPDSWDERVQHYFMVREQCKFEVTPERELHLTNGPGQIETAGDFANFVLQIDCPDLGMGRHIQYADLPLAGVLYTDVERDGTEVGPNLRETLRLAESSSLPVIASGGVGTLEHLRELSATGLIAGAIVGRALHEGRFSLLEALEACGG